jgi:tetratricopeptide (TPR) repeat protein
MKRFAMVFLLSAAAIGGAYAASPAARDAGQSFYAANHLYAAGDYKKAEEGYMAILAKGVENGAIYYNIGNTYFKIGRIGYAILYYERAKRLIPQDGDLKSNLEYARTLLPSSIPEESVFDRYMRYLKIPFADMNLNALSILTLAIYLVIIILSAVFIMNPVAARKSLGPYFILIAVFIVTLTVFCMRYYDEEILRHGVIVLKDVECKYEPIDKSTTYYKLQEGDEVIVLTDRELWRRIKRPDGKIAWVKREAVDII